MLAVPTRAATATRRPCGTATGGIGIRRSPRTRSFLATGFFMIPLAGDSIRRGSPSELRIMDSGLGTAVIIIITSALDTIQPFELTAMPMPGMLVMLTTRLATAWPASLAAAVASPEPVDSRVADSMAVVASMVAAAAAAGNEQRL